jgi:glycosyltransferase involved in cell wall biosynthesis
VSKKLRVAWLGHRSSALAGGMATYSLQMTKGLRDRGVTVVFFHPGLKGDRLPDSLEAVSLDSVKFVRPLVISPPKAKRQLIDRLSQHDFDLVHASFWFSSLDFDLPKVCRQLGIPIVATYHVAFDNRRSLWGGLTNAAYRLYAPTLSLCDRVIVFGQAQKDVLVDLGVPESILRILPNGVDTKIYSPGPSRWKHQIGASRIFTFMGRLDAEKRAEILIKAFLACNPPADVKLVLAGTGSERRHLQRSFKDRRIVFLGHVADESDRIAILRSSDAFFLPSSVEGLSLAMLEAMGCGVPTVATDVGNHGEALRGAGIVLDPTYTDIELVTVIRALLDLPDLLPPLSRVARRRVEERFSLDRNLDSLIGIYQELVYGAERVLVNR